MPLPRPHRGSVFRVPYSRSGGSASGSSSCLPDRRRDPRPLRFRDHRRTGANRQQPRLPRARHSAVHDLLVLALRTDRALACVRCGGCHASRTCPHRLVRDVGRHDRRGRLGPVALRLGLSAVKASSNSLPSRRASEECAGADSRIVAARTPAPSSWPATRCLGSATASLFARCFHT